MLEPYLNLPLEKVETFNTFYDSGNNRSGIFLSTGPDGRAFSLLAAPFAKGREFAPWW